nr:hypothetical protein [Erwinia billingiae]
MAYSANWGSFPSWGNHATERFAETIKAKAIWIVVAAVVMAWLFLVCQYESWTLPGSVLLHYPQMAQE